MRLKKCLSSILALTMVFNTGMTEAFAAGGVQQSTAETQAVSEPETVYVNSYGAEERSVSFNDHWRFYLGDASGAQEPVFNDSAWENVTLPHDYSIDQGFTTAAPAEQESGYVLGGTGWYRKAFTLSEETEGKTVSVDFDGVYMNATVYLNGVKLGTHPYGYSSFSFELPSDNLKFGGQENVLAVKVENKQPSSRWYSGSGIYRDVTLTVTEPVHVGRFGTKVTTPDIADGKGTVDVVTTVSNDGTEAAQVSVQQTVFEKNQTEPVITGERTDVVSVPAGGSGDVEASVTVESPKLWSTEEPNLYTVRTDVYVGDTLTDSYNTEFGFRWTEVTKDNGFFLNGENIKLQGVCLHHDQGGLGSEAWYRSVERQVEIMKEMGVNAIRVTHNPASQALITICNEKGIMLVEEAFDSWLSGKAGNTEDYGKWFSQPIEEGNQIVGGEECSQWAEFDLKEMLRRGRNAPSIVMWSLGNEVFQQTIDSSTHDQYPDVAKNLLKWTAQEDTTRYVTFGDNQFKGNVWGSSNATKTADVIASAEDYGLPGGLPGYNYGSFSQIENGHNKGWMVYGSETASATNSRGVYDRKANNSDAETGDRRLTSYDKSSVSWGHWASDALWITMRQPYNVGEFAWTGFDYIGEPTPYNWQGTGANGTWPNIAKNSYFGIVDTAGFPKDSYYLYQSQWNESVHTLHVLPVWNRDEIVIDSNGKVEVVVYSDAPVVKLYLNGEEVGTAKAVHTDTPTGGYQTYTSGTGAFDSSKASGHTSLYATFNVSYEEGKLEAKAFEEDGTTPITETEGRSFVETTKKASKLTAEADRTSITADGKDLSYITIDTTDIDGKFVNGAEPEITVSVEGDGKLLALDNGVQNDVTSYQEPTRKAGKGKLVAIVQSTKEAGSFTVTATAPGYASASEIVTTNAEEDAEPGERKLVSYVISRNFYVKQGERPVLPEEVTLNYSDGSSEIKTVAWDEIPDSEEAYSVYGTIADVNLRISVNVSMIGEVADVLNYSAAIGKDADLSLPESRPAVLADGTVLAAEFPVTWDVPENVTSELGTKEIQGTASVFDENFTVTASVRVTNGAYIDGDEALPNVPEMYAAGVSSKADESVAQVLEALRDDQTGKDDIAWTGRGTLDFRLDTAIELKDFTLYLRDTAPTSDTVKIYASSSNGASWTQVDCKVTNRREDGVTVRSYAPTETVSETWFRLEFAKTTTLTELEMNIRIPTFPVGSEAALESLKVGGHIADAATLEKGSFAVSETELDVDDITAVGKDNASVTMLPKDSENIIRILLESEDHTERSIFAVMLGRADSGSEDPNDASRDYPYQEMTLSAPSVEAGGSVSWANDGDSNTIWHTNWGGGYGPTDLTNDPANRYLEIQLPKAVALDGLRYLPRATDQNGIVTEYRIETSLDGEEWTAVSTGTWSEAVEWKLAQFEATEASYIRLYGVKTATNDGSPQKYMSAAEVRVRCAATELYEGNTVVTLEKKDQSVPYTGREITPEPTVTYKASQDAEEVILEKDLDYTLSYRNNVEPGVATVAVTGKGNYAGVVETRFTIQGVEVEITGYEPVAVTTGKGETPALPGTVVANTNVGQQILEVRWDKIGDSALNTFGTFTAYGTVVDTKERITAEVTVSDVIGIQPVTLATAAGLAPTMPETVKVYYSNGEVSEREVAWDLSGADFSKAGMVKVTGTVGKSEVLATVRVEEAGTDANNTPVGVNLALNENGVQNGQEWPRTFAYISANNDPAHHVTDGVKDFVSGSGKVIWSDWEYGQYHTNENAAVGAADHLPFVATAFGVDGSTSDSDQKKYTVNRVSIGFMEEDGESASKVRLPADYKIEYYSANDGVLPANRLNNSSATECSNTKGWGADNPIKAHDGWTEVTYIGGKPSVPDLASFKEMVDVAFEPVETTVIRITLTPQAENWTGLEEFEVYYDPVEKNRDYEVTSIQLDGKEVLDQFDPDTKSLTTDAAGGVLTAKATKNASVTVLEPVNGQAKIIFLPENGDETQKQEYTVSFKTEEETETHLVSAEDAMIALETGKAAAGETVTFAAQDGYAFQETPVILRSSDLEETGLEVKAADGRYSFTMPDYDVMISGQTTLVVYEITYDLDGGTVEGNADTYTVETPTFTLNNPTREGAVFLGWTGTGLAKPTRKVQIETGTTGDLNFTANWEEREFPEADDKAGLKAAITIASSLKPEDFTEESYAALTQAIKEASEAYENEELSKEEIQEQIDRLARAVSSLEAAGKEENAQLAEKLEAAKAELEQAKGEVTRLEVELSEKEAELSSLTGELEEAKKSVTDLQSSLDSANKELDELKADTDAKADEIEKLEGQVADLQRDLAGAQETVSDLEQQWTAASGKITELKNALEEAQSRVKLLEAEKSRLQKEADEREAALKKAQEEAAREKAEAEEAIRKAKEEAEKARAEIERLKNDATLKKGDTVQVKGVVYRVTNAAKKQAQAYKASNKNLKTVNVAATVRIKGVNCKVTSVADKAFSKMQKLQKAVIGKHVTSIGKKAFYGDKKLKNITIKSKKLKTVGKQAWKGISAKAVIKVPRAQKQKYKNLMKGKGQKSTVKIQ